MQTPLLRAQDELEISDAALGAYGRLLRAMRRVITTHPARDGGLICEDRTTPAKPILWRISPDGTVTPDSRYNFANRGFVSASLPGGLAVAHQAVPQPSPALDLI